MLHYSGKIPRMSRVYIFIALLFLVSLLVFFYDELFFTPTMWFQGPVDYDKERFIYGALFTVDATIGGVGNNVFELMALLGIAKHVHRIPIISKQSEVHIQKQHSHFVNLLKGFKIGDLPSSSKKVDFPHQCCMYTNPNLHFDRFYSYETVNTELWYAQSYKYFQNFTRHEILERLRLTPPMEEYARKGQVDPSFMQGGDHTICVHSRRGDFIPSTIHAHATEDFVVPALKLLDKRVREKHGSKRPVIVMIGDDKDWMKKVIRDHLPKDFKAVIAQTNQSYPAEVDWEFSRQYCDSVLMAASGSTFGWWLAYNSRGYNVYYNTVFSKPGGFGGSLTPERKELKEEYQERILATLTRKTVPYQFLGTLPKRAAEYGADLRFVRIPRRQEACVPEAIRRRTTGTGRMRHLKKIQHRFKRLLSSGMDATRIRCKH
ncbi:hypothetical protein PRIPAC_79938 [Pristionchus pacificus]|uniref:Uncharacterized protein n=1 Tax=Pristionchus pacificus TaxID=54126 RepID=A0A2A6C1U1_PRIPA|nr:hypothetical protein PRIPAC_79938 [Pristionchus pacificus]|eukprot:PDM72134.1 hypothetical protein PRIPAC_38568 [Pristionchus pacificus]